MRTIFFKLIISLCVLNCFGRIHRLKTWNDTRKHIHLTTFAFYQGASLEVKLFNFYATPEVDDGLFGFSLYRVIDNGMNPYLDIYQDICIQEQPIINNNSNEELIYFFLDFKNKKLQVKGADQKHLSLPIMESKDKKKNLPSANTSNDLNFDITYFEKNYKIYYNATFMVIFETLREGFYNLCFHSYTTSYPDSETFVDFEVQIVELNLGNYLTASETHLPAFYFTMSILFFLAGMFWIFFLKQSRHAVFKIQYMMTVLVFLKAFTLVLNSVNYHYIAKLGYPLSTWATLLYAVHLVQGTLLVIILVLIGTGWSFTKYILTPNDKRLLMVVVPLQVLANIAQIISENTEMGDTVYFTWKIFYILADLICCVCILFPALCTMLKFKKRLQLFRLFYLMLVMYIYFTRVVVYLLQTSVTFEYIWLPEMVKEISTYMFFVLTAYKFGPASQHSCLAFNDYKGDVDKGLELNGEKLMSEQRPSVPNDNRS